MQRKMDACQLFVAKQASLLMLRTMQNPSLPGKAHLQVCSALRKGGTAL